MNTEKPILFDLHNHPLRESLCRRQPATIGVVNSRRFPDGETYLQIDTEVEGRHCIILSELSDPDRKFLPLCFLASTLRELGASSVGLMAPYLSYMRQDRRFIEGEAVTSRIFANLLSSQVDWMVTIDPHLHRYHSLDEIYSIPTQVVQGAPLLSQWLISESNLLLVGPDSESEQWVSTIASYSGHPFVVGEKKRIGDRSVTIELPDLTPYSDLTAVIIDDVISSGQTIIECIHALTSAGIANIKCASVHGIFADGSDQLILQAGLSSLVTTNTIPHYSNMIDVSSLLVPAIADFVQSMNKESQA